jgi:hypothetical protein
LIWINDGADQVMSGFANQLAIVVEDIEWLRNLTSLLVWVQTGGPVFTRRWGGLDKSWQIG